MSTTTMPPSHTERERSRPSMDNLRKAGRIGVKSIGYFLALPLPLRDRESARDRELRSA
jgi:hypothetical protein